MSLFLFFFTNVIGATLLWERIFPMKSHISGFTIAALFSLAVSNYCFAIVPETINLAQVFFGMLGALVWLIAAMVSVVHNVYTSRKVA